MRRLAALLVAAVAFAGCGSGDPDPASIVPADVPVYLEGVIDPEGEQGENADRLLGRILDTEDPGPELRKLLDQVLRSDSPGASFSEDLEPHLGDRLAVAVSGLSAEEPDALVVFSVEDAGAARDALAKGSRRTEYRGEDLYVRRDEAGAVVGDLAVVGDEPLVRKALETKDGEALAEAGRYREAIAELPEERLGLFYLDLAGALRDAGAGVEGSLLRSLFGIDEAKPQAAALLAEEKAFVVEGRARAAGLLGALTGMGSVGSPLLGELPDGVLGAIALNDLGAVGRRVLEGLEGIPGASGVRRDFERRAGLDLERDVLGWMGDAALFVRGDSLETLEGALVIEARDETRAAAAIAKLAPLLGAGARETRLPGADTALRLPVSGRDVFLAVGGGRAVVAVGQAAARDALQAPRRLADGALMREARGVLGDLPPALLVDLPAVFRLAEQAGASSDEGYRKAKRYLDALGIVASGGRADGDDIRSRLAVTVR